MFATVIGGARRVRPNPSSASDDKQSCQESIFQQASHFNYTYLIHFHAGFQLALFQIHRRRETLTPIHLSDFTLMKNISISAITATRHSFDIPQKQTNAEGGGSRTFLSPDISQLVKFAGSDNSQFVDFQGRTFLSYLFCRVGQFSVRTFVSWLICRAGQLLQIHF